jgi:lipoprotein-anchoring transpeptidase ErfK/SrfK
MAPSVQALLKNPSKPLLSIALALLCSCAGDRENVLRVSIHDQQMALITQGKEVARFPVSTSKFGLGDIPGSNCTPLGKFEVARKIGAQQPLGMKFKDRKPTGEIVPVNAPGRDPIVTRILWLRGLESTNQNAFERMIYIHGTPEETKLGTPASYGCVRMRSRDVRDIFNTVGLGARVFIHPGPLPTSPGLESRTVRNPVAPDVTTSATNAAGLSSTSPTSPGLTTPALSKRVPPAKRY